MHRFGGLNKEQIGGFKSSNPKLMAEFVQAQMIPIFPMRILIEGSQIDNKLTIPSPQKRTQEAAQPSERGLPGVAVRSLCFRP